MSSTNKTANYELSQFLGSDKPAWLGDYNTDMGKIDAQMKLNADAATGADGKATTNATNIGTLSNLTTDANSNLVAAINEVDAHADAAQTTATNAATAAGNAQSQVSATQTALNDLAAKFNLTSSSLTVSCAQLTPDAAGTYLTCAKNSDGSLAKIYGRIRFLSGYNGNCVCTTSDTGLRPTNAITINGAAFRIANQAGHRETYSGSYTINANGTVTIEVANSTLFSGVDMELVAVLLFIKDFGDTPQN